MGTVTTRIKRPAFMDYFFDRDQTTRVCEKDGCESPGTYVGGYYLVGTRRVRSWVCGKHRPVGTTIEVLPTPQWILDGIAQQQAEYDKAARFDHLKDSYSQSIKFLAPTGHGKPVATDRVAAWRWGGY